MTFKKPEAAFEFWVVASDLNFLAFAFEMLCCQCNAIQCNFFSHFKIPVCSLSCCQEGTTFMATAQNSS